eukprot:scaffold13373_cov102-Isochrysis_galbana.AAC.2
MEKTADATRAHELRHDVVHRRLRPLAAVERAHDAAALAVPLDRCRRALGRAVDPPAIGRLGPKIEIATKSRARFR